MPFFSTKRHEIWTVDIRYIGHSLAEEGNLYFISVLENHSRALLASAVSLLLPLPDGHGHGPLRQSQEPPRV